MNIIKYFFIILLITSNSLAATVTNDNDNGAGSLRQAISDANAGDTIDFAADYTIVLNNELFIDKDLTIDGIKQNITISGNNLTRVFEINFGTVNLNYLTITQADAPTGGGVMVSGATVTIENSTISDNSASEGGGIYVLFGSLTIKKTLFNNNSALSNGGGIYNSGSLIVQNTTFVNNSASNSGGGIYADNFGSTAIIHATISDNTAADGGGVYFAGGIGKELRNSIIADNTGSDCGGIAPATKIKNLIKDNSCGPDLSGDPKLGPLQNNGGPTQTIGLLTGSPALSSADSGSCLTEDQRGFERPKDGTCDLGAYEPLILCLNQVEIPPEECEALIGFYESTNGPSWNNNDNWTFTPQPCTTWTGVSCSLGNSGNVTGINRSGQNLTGELPDLSVLTSLDTLDLNNNSLTGSFPNISALTNLQSLQVRNSQLTGSIPDLSNLPNLFAINLNNNNLTGSIPNLNNNLIQLELGGNQLTGTITNLSSFTNLTRINLSNNKLEGNIPNLSSLNGLNWLELQNNQFTGIIPNLSSLSLSNTLTDFGYNSLIEETGTSATDKDSDWAATQTIAPTLPTLTVLTDTEIKISWTPIAYTNDIGHYQVKYSTTSGGPYTNAVSTTINKSVNKYTVTGLDVGTIYYFVVETFTKAHDDQQSDLTSILSNEVSATTGSICDTQAEISQAQCETLVAIYNSTDGDNWTDNTGWTLTATPCSWEGISCDSDSPRNVTKIKKVEQNLSGSLPNLSTLIKLTNLELAKNEITGNVPNELNTLTSLSVISMGHNQFTGTIPDLSSLTNLQKLILSYNQLTGTIPTWLNNMSGLGYLSFAGNQLTGIIPDLNNLDLTHLFLANNQLTGTIPTYISDLTNLISLSLYRNKLEESIPNLDNLTSLTNINIDNNQLSGTIPSLPASLIKTDLSYNVFTNETDGTATDKDSDWANSQTIPPILSEPTVLSDTEIKINWTPIIYTGNDGHYQVKYSKIKGGPYINATSKTNNKLASNYTITSLTPATTYYFVVETFTPEHGIQQNDITSVLSEEITGTTLSSTTCSSDITVTNANDNGAGSLRQAIADLCAGGTIIFDNDYHIKLSSKLVIGTELEIDAGTNKITVNGQGKRIFQIKNSIVTFRNLLIKAGKAKSSGIGGYGGGIYIKSGANLTIENSTLKNNLANRGGAIYVADGATLTVNNSLFTFNQGDFNGGAIFIGDNTGATVTINNTIFKSNKANKVGGAIHNMKSSLVTINSSTFESNTAQDGGAIQNDSQMTINNSTFYNNAASGVVGAKQGGGIKNWRGVLEINNSTFANNTAAVQGGGLALIDGNLKIRNTIIAGNSSGDCYLESTTINENINNLIKDSTCNLGITVSGYISGVDPSFSPLQDNGGITDTMALQAGSPAINAGDNATCLTTDQRNIARPQGATCDIGAYETLPACPSGNIAYVDKTATGNNDASDWTNAFTELRSTLNSTFLTKCPGITEIHVAQGTYTPGILRSDTFQLQSNLAIYGGYPNGGGTRNSDPATNNTILSGDIGTSNNTDNSYHVVFSDNTTDNTAILDGFTISGGYAEGTTGGGIFNSGGSPTLNNLIISNNQADGFGGGIFTRFICSPILTNILIENNIAGSGGGFASKASTPTLNNVIIRGNYAGLNAGGVNNIDGSNITMNNVLISGNEAFSKGGGISSKFSKATLTNVTITGNHATLRGGGIRSIATSNSFTLNNVIIWSNTTDELGSESFVENQTGTHSVNYSIIEGSSTANWWTTNNITDAGNNLDADPLFSTPVSGTIPNTSGDLHLSSDSPAINSGNNSDCQTIDLDGITRPQDGICDIGAYEFISEPPAEPSDLIAIVISDSQIDLSWTDNSDNETGFIIERDNISINTIISNSYADNAVTCGTTYNYSVKATNAIGDSVAITTSATTQICASPIAPTNLVATVISTTQINLSWNDNSDNETGFKIERDGNLLNIISIASYIDTSLTCDTTYNYSIKATNNFGDSTAITTSAATNICDDSSPKVYYELTVLKVGNGSITTEHGIDCGNVCKYEFADQTEISLTVTPDSNWLFTGWTGDCDQNGLVRINKDKTCTANFESITGDNQTDNPTTDNPTTNDGSTELDGNGDGILDNKQIYVITIPDAVTGEYLTLESHIGCPIKIASAHTEEEQEFVNENYGFPQGIIYYELQCEKANITIYFHGISKFKAKPIYQKYGPLVPGDLSTLTWYTLPNVIFGVTTVNGKQVATAKFTLIDGELGDNTGVDGRIVDPGGIGFE